MRLTRPLAIALSALSLAAAACGDDSSSTGAEATATTEASADTAAAGAATTTAGSATSAAPEGGTLTIGAIEMLSGSGAFYGKAVQEGLEVAVDELNAGGGILGQKVELKVEDNASDNAQTTTLVKKFAQDSEVGAIIPPTYQPNFNAACSAATEAGLPIVSAQSGPAKDKIFMGAERRSMVMSEEERLMTAYHESGHAVVAKLLPRVDPVHKVTIIPRGRALGVTWTLPERDSLGQDRDQMLQRIAMGLGGRIAEEVFMNRMTTGASNDFENATRIARDMVTRYGMSAALGTMVYGDNEGEVFLGRSITTHKNLSEATLQKVDAEIRRIIDEQYAVARKLIEDHRDKVELMTKFLLEWETLDAEQVNDIMAGRPPRPPKPVTVPPTTPPPDNTPSPAPTTTPAREA